MYSQRRQRHLLEQLESRCLLSASIPQASPLFSESFYLQANPDVSAAVAAKKFASGYDHFAAFGERELRNPSADFSQWYYLGQNHDVWDAVKAGTFGSALEHFVKFGDRELRSPNSRFSNHVYQWLNPDVEVAVQEGQFQSGFGHYLCFGKGEGRFGNVQGVQSSDVELSSALPPDAVPVVWKGQRAFARKDWFVFQTYGQSLQEVIERTGLMVTRSEPLLAEHLFYVESPGLTISRFVEWAHANSDIVKEIDLSFWGGTAGVAFGSPASSEGTSNGQHRAPLTGEVPAGYIRVTWEGRDRIIKDGEYVIETKDRDAVLARAAASGVDLTFHDGLLIVRDWCVVTTSVSFEAFSNFVAANSDVVLSWDVQSPPLKLSWVLLSPHTAEPFLG